MNRCFGKNGELSKTLTCEIHFWAFLNGGKLSGLKAYFDLRCIYLGHGYSVLAVSLAIVDDRWCIVTKYSIVFYLVCDIIVFGEKVLYRPYFNKG